MGLENWIHKKLSFYMRNDEEFLIVIMGLTMISLFLYAII